MTRARAMARLYELYKFTSFKDYDTIQKGGFFTEYGNFSPLAYVKLVKFVKLGRSTWMIFVIILGRVRYVVFI